MVNQPWPWFIKLGVTWVRILTEFNLINAIIGYVINENCWVYFAYELFSKIFFIKKFVLLKWFVIFYLFPWILIRFWLWNFSYKTDFVTLRAPFHTTKSIIIIDFCKFLSNFSREKKSSVSFKAPYLEV
jgi:hypothetical protein